MKKSKHFWNREYKKPAHLALSTEPSGDLEKFTRWQERNYGRQLLNPQTFVLDLGCGNGRNLIFLARDYGCRGLGYDVSSEAIAQAKSAFRPKELSSGPRKQSPDHSESPFGPPVVSLQFEVRSLSEPIPLPDKSVNLVLDMMSSHVLRRAEREQLRDEIWRVLKPGGWFFFKSFLLEEDLNARRMLHDYPAPSLAGQAPEPNSYIHPTFKHFEHVWTIDELEDFFIAQFDIHKIEKSHKHMSHGHAFRRRTVTAYLQKRD